MVEFFTINGAQLAYRLTGPENGPLIITLHGGRGMGDHKSDFKAFSPLADTHRVLSFDMRGHGQSSLTRPYTFSQLVDDVDGLRQHFAGPDAQVIILGGSFGGFLAQQYAITYASRVSHLILRGTAPSHHHEAAAIEILKQRLKIAPSVSVEMLTDKVFGRYESDTEFRLVMHAMSPLYSESFDANAALKKNLETVFRAETHAALYSPEEKYFDYREDLAKVSAKTLIIAGDRDWICPPEQSQLMASKIPNATLKIFENANHSVHHEKNAEVVALIRNHLG